MKEFVNKLIGRLEGLKTYYAEDFSQGYSCEVDCVEKYEVKKIVNELAEEFATDINVVSNNGWISCSERLPEKEVDVLVCFSNDMDCVIAYRTKMMNTNLKDVWVNSSTAQIISSNITAWMPLPAPYQKGSE